MKVKDLGLASIGVLALSIVGTGAYVYAGTNLFSQPRPMAKPAGDQKEEKKMEVPKQDPAVVDAIGRLQHQLGTLSQPRIPEKGEVNLQLLGFSSDSIRKFDAVEMALSEDFSSRVVTMAYTAGQEKYAVIDDRLYREGDKLDASGDATVRSIEPNKVLVAGREVRQWLEVKNTLITEETLAAKKAAAAPQPAAAPTPAVAAARPTAAVPSQSGSSPANAIEALKDYKDILKQLNPNQ